MVQASDFISALTAQGYHFFTGVPCSFLKPLINYVISDERLSYMTATSEGEAVAIASGAYLAGNKAVVMCQNSGLGNMINPLTSLNTPFSIPILLIVTLRGEPGLKDEPQHELMGQITTDMLDTVGIPWALFPQDQSDIQGVLDKTDAFMSQEQRPFALIMQKGRVSSDTQLKAGTSASKKQNGMVQGEFSCLIPDRMARMDAIKMIQDNLPEQTAVIATTGKIGRELFALGDHRNQLYVVGSMGCASSLGLGIQCTLPDQRVVILDGDGAALMKMGSLATIGNYQAKNFIHIILDNEAHESTGGQQTVSAGVDFCEVAVACGYRLGGRVDSQQALIQAVKTAMESEGPVLLHVKVACGSLSDLGRPTVLPVEVKKRFMDFLRDRK